MKYHLFLRSKCLSTINFQDLIEVFKGMGEALPNDYNARNSMIKKVNKMDKSVFYQVPSTKALREAGIPILMHEERLQKIPG